MWNTIKNGPFLASRRGRVADGAAVSAAGRQGLAGWSGRSVTSSVAYANWLVSQLCEQRFRLFVLFFTVNFAFLSLLCAKVDHLCLLLL